MDSINNSDITRIAHNPQQEKDNPGKDSAARMHRESTSPIAHRTCNLAGCLAGASRVQSTEYFPDLPQFHLAKKFYRSKDVEPLIFGDKHRMTHQDFRQLLSKHMDVYAVITDAVSESGAVNIRVIGKPKFKVNYLNGDFHTTAFRSIDSRDLSPFSADLLGLTLESSSWIFYDFFKTLTAKSDNNEKMSLIEKSIFKKLQKQHSGCNFFAAVTDRDYTKDITRNEAKFVFAQSFDECFKEIQKIHGQTPHLNRLNAKATIRDLPEILHHHHNDNDDRVFVPPGSWGLNYLEENLLSNVVWK